MKQLNLDHNYCAGIREGQKSFSKHGIPLPWQKAEAYETHYMAVAWMAHFQFLGSAGD